MCPCPDDHIRKEIAKIFADIIVTKYRRTHAAVSTETQPE